MDSKPLKRTAPPLSPLTPRAWKPVEIRLGNDSLYELHVDGKVYEHRRNMGLLSNPEHSPTVRRVKDRELVDRVHQAFRQQVEQRKSLQGRAAGIVDQLMGGGKA